MVNDDEIDLVWASLENHQQTAMLMENPVIFREHNKHQSCL